jgi:outer membrane protein TolC
MEQIAQTIVNQFFDVYTAQATLDIASKNLNNSDTLYKISEKRYELGKIAENDLLQLELAKLNAEIAYEQALQSLQSTTFIFNMSIGNLEKKPISLILPEIKAKEQVTVDSALVIAFMNSAIKLENTINLLEVEQRLAQVQGETGFRANLFAQIGLNTTPTSLNNPLEGQQQTQNARFGFQMPILDWGSSKSRLKIAKSDYALQSQQVEISLINQEQKVVEAVYRFNINIKQQKISAKADTVGQRRYYIAKQRYLLGKISITDLNLAQIERDNAELANLSIQRAYWNSLYELRKLCLYDFYKKRNISYVDREKYVPMGL